MSFKSWWNFRWLIFDNSIIPPERWRRDSLKETTARYCAGWSDVVLICVGWIMVYCSVSQSLAFMGHRANVWHPPAIWGVIFPTSRISSLCGKLKMVLTARGLKKVQMHALVALNAISERIKHKVDSDGCFAYVGHWSLISGRWFTGKACAILTTTSDGIYLILNELFKEIDWLSIKNEEKIRNARSFDLISIRLAT